ncbi:MAG: hypothetical protein R2747_00915 [Pyrinomonadaceae bacterium]
MNAKINFNSFVYAKKLPFFIIILTGFLTIFFPKTGFAQETPCLDLRERQVEFLKPQRKTLDNLCRKTRKTASIRESLGGTIAISGHITHQNGVRMGGITMTLTDLDAQTSRTVQSDETGNYLFGNLIFGTRYQLVPSSEGYEFFPPSITWEGIVEDEIQNFIAVGPPPEEPPVPPGTPVLAWSSYYDGQANLADYNAMLARDAQGNVYLGGTSYSDPDSGDTDIVISKTDANGNLLWSKRFNGTANYKDGLRDLAVDASGNIYLTGFTYSLPASGTLRSYDFVTSKYDTDGNMLWSKTYGKTDGFDDFPRSLKIDALGNVYVTGYSWDSGLFADYATLKYDTAGNLLWVRRFSTSQGESSNEIEVDSAGNVYVTGAAQNGPQGGSEDIFTIKYDADGNELWQNRYNSTADDSDEGLEIEIDAFGDVYVLGQSYINFSSEAVIQKINGGDGSTAWTKSYVVPASFDGTVPTAMKLDADGNIIMTGMTNLTGEFYNVDAYTAKFDSNGTFQWLKTYDGLSDEDYDGDTKLALDGDGNIYVGATSEGFANADMEIIKYAPDGTEAWKYRFGNPFFDYDVLMDWGADVAQTTILLDETGNVYVAGESFVPGQGSNLVAFKLEPEAQLRATQFDFDGDKKADIAVFRPESGVWYILRSSDGGYSIVKWGLDGDKLVPADYDGDGKNDLAVYRQGVWYVQKSSDNGFLINQFGLPDDEPVPSDFDNDGRADLGVFRQGIWHQLKSSDNSYKAFQFGLGSDLPLPSDYDKNRRSDVAVFRGGTWYVQYQAELPVSSFQFGLLSDKTVPADYDGDGQTDFAVFRDGVWYVRLSRTDSLKAFQWGSAGDIPVPADYDGDKKTDLAVYRSGVWYVLNSSDNNYSVVQFGLATDIPIPAAYSR